MRALVIDDETAIVEAVAFVLTREGWTVSTARSIAEARALAGDQDLWVVDLGLPDGSGYVLVAECARRPGSPRIIVLSSREEEIDGVAALEAGADDYVEKPFSPRALAARARAVTRRPRPEGAPPDGGLHVDLSRREASYAGRRLGLTRIELDLLAVLAAAPGRVFTRAQLVARVWGDGHALTERTIDSHVKALRHKLEDASAPRTAVVAVRGVGFKWNDAA